MFRVINNHRQPITLTGGIILAAAGTLGSTREVEAISDGDRRRHAGRIAVVEIAPAVTATVPESPASSPASSEDVAATKLLDQPMPAVESAAEADNTDQRSRRRTS